MSVQYAVAPVIIFQFLNAVGLEEMALTKIALVTMFASGIVLVASLHVEGDLEHQDWEDGPESNECGFCYYYFQTGRGPYEVLWKLGSEVRPHMSQKSQVLMLMDPGRLKVAEYFFNDYCRKMCGKGDEQLRQESGIVTPCQREKGIINHEL